SAPEISSASVGERRLPATPKAFGARAPQRGHSRPSPIWRASAAGPAPKCLGHDEACPSREHRPTGRPIHLCSVRRSIGFQRFSFSAFSLALPRPATAATVRPMKRFLLVILLGAIAALTAYYIVRQHPAAVPSTIAYLFPADTALFIHMPDAEKNRDAWHRT